MYALLNNYYNIIIMFTMSNVPFTKVLLSFYFLYPEEGCIINFDFDFDYIMSAVITFLVARYCARANYETCNGRLIALNKTCGTSIKIIS